MAAAYYYPEGPLGPVCDVILPDVRKATFVPDRGDGRVVTYGPIDWSTIEPVLGYIPPAIVTRKCKVRELPNGEIEYYDCKDEFLDQLDDLADDKIRSKFPQYPLIEYPWRSASQSPWGLDDNFQEPDITPESCSPFDADINSIPIRIFADDGSFVTKIQVERSSPPTFNVTSGGETIVNQSTISAAFNSDSSALVVSGTGTGIVKLRLSWDDNPNDAGTAVDTISITGDNRTATWRQRGEEGDDTSSVQVTAGTSYTINYSGLNSANNPIDQASPTSLRLLDGDSDDTNASFQITGTSPLETVTNLPGYWSDTGNKYAVWTNAEVCTLPFQTQTVTYQVPIPSTGTYGFEFGCDDSAEMFLDSNPVPLFDVVGGIFFSGPNSTPHTTTTTLNAGILTLVVNCTNSAAGFVDANGDAVGEAFSWDRNPGGWYIKICQGGNCISGTSIPWVRSSPHPNWSDFMNTYAVFSTNKETLSGIPQSATWNVNVPQSGNLVLEVQGDNSAAISWDGSSLGTVTSFTSSTTYTINNVSKGPHTLGAIVTNTANAVDNWSNNPAGVAWTLKSDTLTSNVSVEFDSSGNIVTAGTGSARVDFDFEWDDNPNTAGVALSSVDWSDTNLEFYQKGESGNQSGSATLSANRTYFMNRYGGAGGLTIQDNDTKICFKDGDGSDCNAEVRIDNITQLTESIIATSLDLSTPNDGNLIWHTRLASGYKYIIKET
ncbi:PA14 domain-containing protein [Synechococcus phage ACG-2014a]|uniref:PA14 domain-containing protein n=1 Tax=Synechococcus phage ACG-2014a TaxID=1493507 RepID=A0A0E3FZX9_9CAUD|nr:PA14 domain-containing protein [Synechococcus phage ACG-2014a]